MHFVYQNLFKKIPDCICIGINLFVDQKKEMAFARTRSNFAR